MESKEVLQQCTVEGLLVKLPNIVLDRKLYMQVAKALNLIGGKWKGGKVSAFVFKEDPTELLKQIAGGTKVNLKKEFQFFATPDSLADKLVEMADVHSTDYILEPSAGQGAIIKAIQRVLPVYVNCYELMPVNNTILQKLESINILGEDFLNCPFRNFDKIIANPPFAKNQDITHIMKMYECLEVGGTLVSVASKHWQMCNNKKETAFREWLDSVNAEITEIPADTFKESGTKIATCIIKIVK